MYIIKIKIEIFNKETNLTYAEDQCTIQTELLAHAHYLVGKIFQFISIIN